MPEDSRLITYLLEIDSQRDWRIRGAPFLFHWDVHRREDAFNEALQLTMETGAPSGDYDFATVESAFLNHARETINRLKSEDQQHPLLSGYVIDQFSVLKARVAPPREEDEVATIDRERLLFVRMVIGRGCLPSSEDLIAAARSICRENGSNPDDMDQVRAECDRLLTDDLEPRKRKTRERMADIDHYIDRAKALAHQCPGDTRVAAIGLAEGMALIRRHQSRKNHAKTSPSSVQAVPVFAELRAHAIRLASGYQRGRAHHGAGPDQELLLGLLATFELFASLFPRADQLGRCLRLCRLLTCKDRLAPLRADSDDLRSDLEAIEVLAKLHDEARQRLADWAMRLARHEASHGSEAETLGILRLTVLWLRAASTEEASQRRDELPALDSSWWTHADAGDPDALFEVLTAINRCYRLRSA